MKPYLLALSLIACSLDLMSQSAYLDASTLRRYVKNGKFDASLIDSIQIVLAPYVREEEGETIRFVFAKNPYIRRYIDETFPQSGQVTAIARSIVGRVGGVDVTQFAEGLARFLVERTKQELSVAFFEDFRETINDPRYEDLRIIFPSTAFLLQTIDRDIYQFSIYLQSLRENFIADLESLYINFPEVIRKPKYDPIFERLNIRYLKEILFCGLHITGGLKNELHPGFIIETLPVNDFSNEPHLMGLLQTAQLLSSSLRDHSYGEDTKYWAAAREVYRLLRDPVSLDLFLGLVYEKAKPITFGDGNTLSGVMERIQPMKDSVQQFVQFVLGFAERVETVQQQMKALADNRQNVASDYHTFFNAVLRVFRHVDNLNRLPFLRIQLGEKYGQFLFVSEHVNALYLDVTSKNFSSAVMHTISIFDTIVRPIYNAEGTTVVRYPRFRSALIRYGNFIAGVASAESSGDVQRAIEAVALPVGSASVKKHAYFNVSLNAYVGPFVGSQKLASDRESRTATGIFSPVGVAFSTALGGGRRPGSLSLFASIIDVGALTTFRFANDDTLAGDVQVKLSQIVAPGIHFAFGVPRWPVSIGFGHHWLPLLSKVERTATTLNDSKGKRWQFFVAVDIPVLNFYNRSR